MSSSDPKAPPGLPGSSSQDANKDSPTSTTTATPKNSSNKDSKTVRPMPSGSGSASPEKFAILLIPIVIIISAIMAHYGHRGHQVVIGIDLGTTYSVIAVKRIKKDGEDSESDSQQKVGVGVQSVIDALTTVEVIPNFQTKKKLTPSVVSYLKWADALKLQKKKTDGSDSSDTSSQSSSESDTKGHTFSETLALSSDVITFEGVPVLVGHNAEVRRKTHPQQTVFHAKRFIGRSVTEVPQQIAAHPFQVGNRNLGNREKLMEYYNKSMELHKEVESSYGKSPVRLYRNVTDSETDSNSTMSINFEDEQYNGVIPFDPILQKANLGGVIKMSDSQRTKILDNQQKQEKAKTKEQEVILKKDDEVYYNEKSELAEAAENSDASDNYVDEDEIDLHINQTAAEFFIDTTASSSSQDKPPTPSGFWVTPSEVGAAIIKTLKLSAEKYLNHEIYQAVITVPAKFGKRETQKTIEAFQLAGLKVARVMDEPTAAAVAYGLHKGAAGKTVLVFDLGGGTLDASLLAISPKSVNVLGTSGDDRLGGADFDQILGERVLRVKLEDETERKVPKSKLLVLAEQCKKSLSLEKEFEVSKEMIEGLYESESGSESALPSPFTITRQEFEDASDNLFTRALLPVRQVLKDQMMQPRQVNHVVLVGGASRMPRIRQLLAEEFGGEEKIYSQIDPDVTVAVGAANMDAFN